MTAWKITCDCGHTGDERDFEMSLVGECYCPRCGRQFILEEDDDDDVEGGES